MRHDDLKGREVEDGMGFSGLVPTAEERREAMEKKSVYIPGKIIDALDAAGYIIVPREPTQAILDALYGCAGETTGGDEHARNLYATMIRAAGAPGQRVPSA